MVKKISKTNEASPLRQGRETSSQDLKFEEALLEQMELLTI